MPHTCATCEGEADDEFSLYCTPCRARLVLPCPCGGTYEHSTDHRGMTSTTCPDCGTLCAYWDDEDLVEPPATPRRAA